MRVPIVAFQEDALESWILFFRFVPFIDSEDAWSILADALDEGRSRGIEPSAAAEKGERSRGVGRFAGGAQRAAAVT